MDSDGSSESNVFSYVRTGSLKHLHNDFEKQFTHDHDVLHTAHLTVHEAERARAHTHTHTHTHTLLESSLWSCSVGLVIGRNFVIQYASWYMGHDTIISWYIAIWFILRYVAIFNIVHWKCKNRVKLLCYDLYTSHLIILIIYWQIKSKQFK